MTGAGSLLKEAWEIVPVLLLLVVGGLIAVQSGVRHSATGRRGLRQVAANLSQIFLRILGYVAVLLTLQYCVGLRPSLGW
jgi:hypothetical protein